MNSSLTPLVGCKHPNDIGWDDLPMVHKCMVAIRQLRMTLVLICLMSISILVKQQVWCAWRIFCREIIEAFRHTYLRKPTTHDAQFLIDMHERPMVFPECLIVSTTCFRSSCWLLSVDLTCTLWCHWIKQRPQRAECIGSIERHMHWQSTNDIVHRRHLSI